MEAMKPILAKAATGDPLSPDDAEAAFEIIMSGEATPSQIGGFLMALRVRGETVEEIAAGAKVMRAKSLKVQAPADAIDTCGTGGDAKGTYNISTAASFVVAGCGVRIAKHGNRALSSKSGSAEVLQELGVKIDITPEDVTRCIEQAGIGFMMAPLHHSAMKHVGPTRQELGTRTIFNLLGPLSNPAGTKRQLIGVFDRQWVRPLAEVLKSLGSERAWIVHGSDGLDELTTTGVSYAASLADSGISEFEVNPSDYGIPTAQPDDLVGGTPSENASALRDVLEGAKGPYRDIVVLNSAAALVVAGKADDLAGGVAQATSAIDQGAALAALTKLVAVSQES